MRRRGEYVSDPLATLLNKHRRPVLERSGTAAYQQMIDAVMAQAISVNAQTATVGATTGRWDPYNNVIKLAGQRRQRPIVVNGTTYQADLIEINRVNLVAAGLGEHFERMTVGSGTPTITADVAAVPNGEVVGDCLVEGAGTGLHSVAYSITKAAAATAYSGSVYVKALAGSRSFRFQLDDGTTTNGVYITINQTTGAVVTAPTAFGTGWSVNTTGGTSGYTVALSASGWYRITLSVTSDATTTIRAVCAMENAGSISYAGDSASGVYLWALDVEAGAFPSSAILNRNCILSSETLGSSWATARTAVSSNAVADPLTGNTTADKLTEDATASNTHILTQAFTKLSSASYTFTVSVYAKADTRSWFKLELAGSTVGSNYAGAYFDLTNGVTGSNQVGGSGFSISSKAITSVGNGWYRCSITVTTGTESLVSTQIHLATADLTNSYSGNGTSGAYFWGVQLEYGTVANGYWPTNTAAGQRGPDATTVAFVPSITSGTLYSVVIPNLWSVSPSAGGQSGTTTILSGGTTANSVLIQVGATLVTAGRGDAGGSETGGDLPSLFANRTIGTAGATWVPRAATGFHNGVVGTEDNGLTPPYTAETSAVLGNLLGSSRYIDGWVLVLYLPFAVDAPLIGALESRITAP